MNYDQRISVMKEASSTQRAAWAAQKIELPGWAYLSLRANEYEPKVAAAIVEGRDPYQDDRNRAPEVRLSRDALVALRDRLIELFPLSPDAQEPTP